MAIGDNAEMRDVQVGARVRVRVRVRVGVRVRVRVRVGVGVRARVRAPILLYRLPVDEHLIREAREAFGHLG